jgi:phage baseplate assembly protein V
VSREALAEHDRMIAAMLMPGHVVAIDTVEAMVRIDSRGWVSPWVRWHSLAAGQARHWRAPSMNEKGSLICPHGQPQLGRFIPGLYSEDFPQPDNRDHVEVWRFEDGGSLVYDWEASTYDITLPTGTGTIRVGGSVFTVKDSEVSVDSASIKLNGNTEINGTLLVSKDVTGLGKIIDTGGNTPNHAH